MMWLHISLGTMEWVPTLYKYGDAHRGPLFPYCEFHPHHSDEPDLHLPRDLYTATYTPNPLQETTTTTHNIKDNMSAQGYYGQGYPPQGGPPPQPGYAPQGYAPQGQPMNYPQQGAPMPPPQQKSGSDNKGCLAGLLAGICCCCACDACCDCLDCLF